MEAAAQVTPQKGRRASIRVKSNVDSPSYCLRQRGNVNYEDPDFSPPDDTDFIPSRVRSTPKALAASTPSKSTPKRNPKDSKRKGIVGDMLMDSGKGMHYTVSPALATPDTKSGKDRTTLKLILRSTAKDSTPPASPMRTPTRSKIQKLNGVREDAGNYRKYVTQELQSESLNEVSMSSPVIKECKVTLAKLSPKTPKTPVNAGSTNNLNQCTPLRSTTIKKVDSVVRKLDSSLSEVSPALPTVRKRHLRSKPAEGRYFECSSDSDFEYSSDSDTENEGTTDDEISAEEKRTITNHGYSTPLRNKPFFENPPLSFPKVQDTLSHTLENRDFSPRRTPTIANIKNTPRSETFFIAEKRIKFGTPQSTRKAEEMKKMREAKPKKPRKGNRQGIDKISSKARHHVAPNYSVTKESVKIPLDIEFQIPWNTEHSDSIEELHKEIIQDFPRWLILLREGFNVMLHGYGSKQFIFDSFSNFLEDKYTTVIINGLFTKFQPRKFVLDLTEAINPAIQILPSSILSMTDQLLRKIENGKTQPIFLFVLNFDILAARHRQMLEAISGLARIPFVHVIASCDHINAGLGITPLENLYLNFTWIDCTTYENYHKELVWNSNVFGSSIDASNAESSIEHIFKSLTTNAKKAFGILAGLQLKKLKSRNKSTSFQGVEFRELLRLCREAFVAQSELALKTLLTEFVDHKLLRYTGKGKNDDNFLIIDLEESALENYV